MGKVNERKDEWRKGKERKDERVIGKVYMKDEWGKGKC